MFECYECGYELDEDDKEFECPFCGRDDYGEGFITCENCGALNTIEGDVWECPWCENDGPTETIVQTSSCPSCGGDLEDDEYCEECGWPDVNQGWVGENYG